MKENILRTGIIVDKKNMLKEGIIVDKKTRKKKLSELDILKRITTAGNIAIGDDGHRAKEVLDIFVELCSMSEKEYKKQVKYYG